MSPVLLAVLGCASILPAYESARDDALADPGPAPQSWAPDAVIHLSAALVDEVVASAIQQHGTLEASIDAGLFSLHPDLEVQRLKVVRGADCDDCLGVEISLRGDLRWSTPLVSGATPVTADGRLDATFELTEGDGQWVVSVRPRRLRDLVVELGTVKASVAGLSSAVREWIDAGLLVGVPAQPITRLGGAELPVRAVRLVPDGRTIQIHALTTVPEPGRVAVDGPRPEEGWRMDIAQSTLLALARAEAFRAGAVSHDVVPEPTSLEVTADGFALGLRLWRIKGRGWWRDYVIHGTVEPRRAKLKLTPTDVVEGERSPGATWVDPLAALGEGRILQAIEGAVDTTLPLSVEQAELVHLEAVEGALRATGTFAMKDPRPRERRK